MPATAENLRELHALHQRAKALRDRLVSGPKTLAAREAVLATRQAALEKARKDLKDHKAQVKLKEAQLQGHQSKAQDLQVKRNQARKQDEYNALVLQIHNEEKAIERLEVDILEGMERSDAQAAELAALEADVKALAEGGAAMRADLDSKSGSMQAQLRELETAITEAEAIIPDDQREQYRRVVKQRGADALAAAESGACSGCFVSVTAQMMNELINAQHLVFCKTCGRILYLAEEEGPSTRRTVR